MGTVKVPHCPAGPGVLTSSNLQSSRSLGLFFFKIYLSYIQCSACMPDLITDGCELLITDVVAGN